MQPNWLNDMKAKWNEARVYHYLEWLDVVLTKNFSGDRPLLPPELLESETYAGKKIEDLTPEEKQRYDREQALKPKAPAPVDPAPQALKPKADPAPVDPAPVDPAPVDPASV